MCVVQNTTQYIVMAQLVGKLTITTTSVHYFQYDKTQFILLQANVHFANTKANV